jgi:hypothetical protein
VLFRHLTSFTIPILERVLDEMAGSEIVRLSGEDRKWSAQCQNGRDGPGTDIDPRRTAPDQSFDEAYAKTAGLGRLPNCVPVLFTVVSQSSRGNAIRRAT